MRWAASRGDHRGVAGCSELGGGTNLGGVAIGDFFGFDSSSGVGTRPGNSNTDMKFCGSATCTLMVYFGGVIGGVRG